VGQGVKGIARETGAPLGGDDVRVVVVDDSGVVRLVVGEVLRREEGVTLAGTAANGREALQVVERAHPHVVVLDIEMPVLDGLGALRELKKRWPKLPVVMFSTLTERGASATLQALAEGADDYLTKPSTTGGPTAAFAAVREGLVPLVRNWGSIARKRETASSSPTLPKSTSPVPARPAQDLSRDRPSVPRRPTPLVTAIVMGSSTGGPNALSVLVPSLPADLPVPLLLVQHMPPTFTRLLAERLDSQSALSVHEAVPGTVVQPGNLYVAPGGCHMLVSRRQHDVVIKLEDGPPENSCKPSVDVLFRSAAATWGAGALGVVLTGMGQDGLVGSQAITEAGGAVIAQDEVTSVVWGMPGAVARAGLAAEVVPLGEVASRLALRARRSGPSRAEAYGLAERGPAMRL
jgi:two-component system chemotaxis response regulator CheB